MNNVPTVRPLELIPNCNYSAVIGTVGFERRARFLAETLRPRGEIMVATGFRKQQVLNYATNKEWYRSNGYETRDLDDAEYRDWCHSLVGDLTADKGATAAMWVDISSTSRLRLAVLVDEIRRVDHPILVDFVYSVAEFTEPSPMNLGNTHVGPVTSNYAGWASEPNRPSVAIVGLGYEQDKALGAVEHTQATDVWVFEPKSSVERYSTAMEEANRILLESIPEARRIEYVVERPFDCFVMLESLISRISLTASPVLFPFGPKIFHLSALLVSCLHPRRVAVWRVSTGGDETPVDRLSASPGCGLRVAFSPPSKAEAQPPHLTQPRA
jgi:hypothetical protein